MVKEMHYHENTLLECCNDFAQNVAQYPQLYVTYAPAKCDVATSHG